MFSALFLICAISEGVCVTVASEEVFTNETMCEAVAEVLIDDLYEKFDVPDLLVTHRCINWGVPA